MQQIKHMLMMKNASGHCDESRPTLLPNMYLRRTAQDTMYSRQNGANTPPRHQSITPTHINEGEEHENDEEAADSGYKFDSSSPVDDQQLR